MKSYHKLFFAIPFDSATKNLYKKISDAIRSRYSSITTFIGSDEVGPSPTYNHIASFKAQNRELNRQFVDKIEDSDIVIADLTHNNPNVHVELGIAIIENKNILRVTGRSLTELGFDIRNLDVHQYKDEADLTTIITKYLDIFFEIKKLPITNDIPELYFKRPDIPINLIGFKRQDTNFLHIPARPYGLKMRDGAFNAEFIFLNPDAHKDQWFGIYLRVGANFLLGSYLVFVRPNGELKVAVYPGPRELLPYAQGQPLSGRQVLKVEFENNYLEASIGSTQLEISDLSYQAPGEVFPAAWNINVDVHLFEMVCRDTID